ncbi:hypothetical protein FQN60_002626 [Etheostoma spectabile]|uniref:Uncharacterized protein n=1 Tax=Etheostoma spectabile TaxID=54343 RepID=A0A5J5CJD9_9PERO|nr:hypothetical protein FQN60_002626 [Etheostoma spectabile]
MAAAADPPSVEVSLPAADSAFMKASGSQPRKQRWLAVAPVSASTDKRRLREVCRSSPTSTGATATITPPLNRAS